MSSAYPRPAALRGYVTLGSRGASSRRPPRDARRSSFSKRRSACWSRPPYAWSQRSGIAVNGDGDENERPAAVAAIRRSPTARTALRAAPTRTPVSTTGTGPRSERADPRTSTSVNGLPAADPPASSTRRSPAPSFEDAAYVGVGLTGTASVSGEARWPGAMRYARATKSARQAPPRGSWIERTRARGSLEDGGGGIDDPLEPACDLFEKPGDGVCPRIGKR